MDVRRNHPAFESEPEITTPPPPPPVPTFSERLTRAPLTRTLALIAAAGTALAGLVTACGAVTVNVIEAYTEAKARRTNAEIDRRLEAVETRVNADFGLGLETKTRQEKDAELQKELETLKAEIRAPEPEEPRPRRRR